MAPQKVLQLVWLASPYFLPTAGVWVREWGVADVNTTPHLNQSACSYQFHIRVKTLTCHCLQSLCKAGVLQNVLSDVIESFF